MELKDTIAALRAGWFLPVIGLLLGGGVAALATLLMTPTYTSSTQLLVTSTDASTTTAAYQGSQFSQNRVTSYVQLLKSERLSEGVISELDLGIPAEDLQERIEASVVPDTTVLNVVVTDTSAERARDLTVTIAEQFSALVDEIETATTVSPDPAVPPVVTVPVKVTVLDTPEAATTPSSPSLERNIAVGVLVGLILGFATAYLRLRLDRSVRDVKDAAALTGAPVIGLLPRDPELLKTHVLSRNSRSLASEGYRQLRTNLQFLSVDEPPRVIMVASSVPSEGKTTLAVNLAVTLAEGGKKVTVVEADLRRPRVVRYLGLVEGAGLTNVLSGNAELGDVLQGTSIEGLSVLAAGSIPPNPSELLSSARLRTVVDELRATNDYVIVDTPPLLPVSDGSAIAVSMDGVLLSVRYGSTERDALERAQAVLAGVGAKTLGVVFNIMPPRADVATSYGYYDAEQPTAAVKAEPVAPSPAPEAQPTGSTRVQEGARHRSTQRERETTPATELTPDEDVVARPQTSAAREVH